MKKLLAFLLFALLTLGTVGLASHGEHRSPDSGNNGACSLDRFKDYERCQ